MRRKTVSGIMLSLLLIGTLFLTFNIQPVEAEPTTIIVPDDFSTIQEAIRHANSGDVVYVRSGVYYESIVINRSISVVGELSHRPLLDGDKAHWPVKISANNVTFSNFRVRRSMGIYGYGGGGIYLVNSNFCVVTNNRVMDNQYGIGLYGSSNNLIHNNLLEENQVNILCMESMLPSDPFMISRNNTFVANILRKGDTAIALLYVSEGRIIGNTIVNNSRGITFESSVDVATYHNNFINNTDQILFRTSETCTWDNGCEGNYWSDYTGADSDGDGIGDTPYVIDENNQDNYPLINPYSSTTGLNVYITKGGETYLMQLFSNATILHLEETPGSIELTVYGESGTSAYVKIIQPVGLNSTNIKVFLDDTRLTFPSNDPPRSISTNGTHYFIYFEFTLSTHEITIQYSIVGDATGDGYVNVWDLSLLSDAWLTTSEEPDFDLSCDFNWDDVINVWDLGIMSDNWLYG